MVIISMIGHPQLKLYHLKPETLKHVEIIKVQHITVLIHHKNGLELEITDFEYFHDRAPTSETIPSQT